MHISAICKSKTLALAIFNVVINAGGKIRPEDYNFLLKENVDVDNVGYLYFDGNVLHLHNESTTPYVQSSHTYTLIRLDEFTDKILNILNKKNITVQLNDNYIAEYQEGDDTISVGCQFIKIQNVFELADKIRELNK